VTSLAATTKSTNGVNGSVHRAPLTAAAGKSAL
jgi:hypothetical protein